MEGEEGVDVVWEWGKDGSGDGSGNDFEMIWDGWGVG